MSRAPWCARRGEDTGRLHLTHKELLGTWEQNAALFAPGQTVPGIIRSVESYGVFVELTPNLTGLAEWQEGLCVGETAVVYIKSMQKERMKIKLLIADHFPHPHAAAPSALLYRRRPHLPVALQPRGLRARCGNVV